MFLIVLKLILRPCGCGGHRGSRRREAGLTGLLREGGLALGLAVGLLLALSERVALGRRSGHLGSP